MASKHNYITIMHVARAQNGQQAQLHYYYAHRTRTEWPASTITLLLRTSRAYIMASKHNYITITHVARAQNGQQAQLHYYYARRARTEWPTSTITLLSHASLVHRMASKHNYITITRVARAQNGQQAQLHYYHTCRACTEWPASTITLLLRMSHAYRMASNHNYITIMHVARAQNGQQAQLHYYHARRACTEWPAGTITLLSRASRAHSSLLSSRKTGPA